MLDYCLVHFIVIIQWFCKTKPQNNNEQLMNYTITKSELGQVSWVSWEERE